VIRPFLGAGLMLVAIGFGITNAEEPSVSPRADALDLLVLSGKKPTRLELRVNIDGKSVPAIWDETFARLLAFYDCDSSGSFDQTEAARLPSAFALRQVLWGQFTPFSGEPPSFKELDANGDGKTSGAELADYYRRAGLGGVLVGIGKPPATEQLTAALLKHLDTNKDGKVDEAEWKAAATSLRKLDTNDDELIGPGELVSKIAYPGALGSLLLAAPVSGGKPDTTIDTFPLIVLPLRNADTHWLETVKARRAKEKLPLLTTEELRKTEASAWQVEFGGKNKEGTLAAVGGKQPVNARLALTVDSIHLELRTDSGQLDEQTTVSRKRLLAMFADCDVDSNDKLDATELGTPKGTQLKRLAEVADRDGDGKLDRKELTFWLELQEQIARGHVVLTILDHGRGLFEFLDANRDGALSVRELRTAHERLKAIEFDRLKLPQQMLASISRGRPQHSIGKPAQKGPDWFRAMDRNGDGDVSLKEWVAELDAFRKLDKDGDELVSAAEADRATDKK